MVRIHEIKLKSSESADKLRGKAERKLKLPKGSLFDVHIVRESLDAREKPEIFKVYSLDLVTDLSDVQLLAAAEKAGIKAGIAEDRHYELPVPRILPQKRPVVVGFGPCGMFAALVLARCGLRPVILERGPAMEERIAKVENFWKNGVLDPEANVQFGEGGAGTFSDGKLTTGTRDAAQRFVLESFVDAGASSDILIKQHPHIGTDVLRTVVVALRRQIEACGGEFFFDSKLTGIRVADGKLTGVEYMRKGRDEPVCIETDAAILALGHSARDSMEYLYRCGIAMEQKPFSMGVRIEHPQRFVDFAQYAAPAESLGLDPAEYKLFTKTDSGRGVYTFCMCPGGSVVAAASMPGHLVTNGMSNSDRGGKNANSALLCDVRPDDFGSDHPLAGMYFQEKYERLAFEAGGGDYRAPAESVGSFLGTAPFRVRTSPTYAPGVRFTKLEKCLPEFVAAALKEALPKLGRKMKGFDDPDAMMTGIESRSSSPVRILRGETREAVGIGGNVIQGLYPGGEGAGYAGGIMSAACDGIHLAEAIVNKL